MIVSNVVQPGAGMNIDPATLDTAAVATYSQQAHDSSVVGFLMAIIPTTMLSALTDGSLLQVLLVAILFGVSLSLAGEVADRNQADPHRFEGRRGGHRGRFHHSGGDAVDHPLRPSGGNGAHSRN